MRRALALFGMAAVLVLAACGDDDDDGADAGSDEPAATETSAAPEPPAEQEAGGNLKDTSVKPEIPKPEGEAPAKLVTEDVVKGKGPVARNGSNLTMNYVGVLHSTGEQFDASWDTGQPFEFQLGAGMVIPGWDQGIAGMRQGGRRTLTIPPDLAYGAAGSPPVIGPNETLVFVVDLLKVR